MSTRLKPQWTATLGEAFGPNGDKGTRGEWRAYYYLDSFPEFKVIYKPRDKLIQTSGIDIFLQRLPDIRWHRIDVKNNLYENSPVYVDVKIFKTKSLFWIHLNDSDDDDLIAYYTSKMRRYITEHNLRKRINKTGGAYYSVPRIVANGL